MILELLRRCLGVTQLATQLARNLLGLSIYNIYDHILLVTVDSRLKFESLDSCFSLCIFFPPLDYSGEALIKLRLASFPTVTNSLLFTPAFPLFAVTFSLFPWLFILTLSDLMPPVGVHHHTS